ncbi:MAG TPA: DNA-directed RNA polymerase subunit alpha [Longimicrobiales bacterium]|nr:DNA-directed RNA polymerase subunit alpha [Longimicrobiales bacterium]
MELDLTGLVLPQRIEVTQRSEDGRMAQFVISPLERGFGQTLGNTVRRILLSSLRGSAVWAFRMDGVVHEHQTVQGVVEDVHQIIQNLKTLVLSLEVGRDEATLELRASKAGAVSARSISNPGGATIINPDHHLFTLQDDREVNMQLFVNKGRGFVTAEQHPLPKGSAVDMVRVDSIYNPVLRANFSVEETRVGQRTDYDQLTLHVETNGSVSPDDSVGYSAGLARKHLEYMLRFAEPLESSSSVPGAVRVPPPLKELFRRPIDELAELSVRSVNSLKKEDIITLGDLVQRTEEQMLNIENFGIKSLEEIRQFLNEHNLHFGMKLEEGEDGELFLIDDRSREQPAGFEAGGARDLEDHQG